MRVPRTIGPQTRNRALARILDEAMQGERLEVGGRVVVALTPRQIAAIDEAATRLAESLDQE